MRFFVSAMLVVVGIIHLLPLSGVLGAERLATLYGLPFAEPNLAILMRRRAVLFGLLGLFFIFAALRPCFKRSPSWPISLRWFASSLAVRCTSTQTAGADSKRWRATQYGVFFSPLP